MKHAPIVIISGPPGAGKSSVAQKLAENSASNCAVHMHTYDFYQYIRKGYIPTWLSEAREQNVIDTTRLSILETVSAIKKVLANEEMRL